MVVPLEMRLVGEFLPVPAPRKAYLLADLPAAGEERRIVVLMPLDVLQMSNAKPALTPWNVGLVAVFAA